MLASASAMMPDVFSHDARGESSVMTCLQMVGSHSSTRSLPSSYPTSRL